MDVPQMDCTEEEELEEQFGTLLSITNDSLVALVSNALKRNSDTDPPTTGRLVSRENGSYNLVHIVELDNGLKYVVRVPITGWGGQFTGTAQRSFTSQVLTMRFIKKETSIPIPEVYTFDITSENEIGAPYILMSFIPGLPVSKLWFDETGPTPLEERRLRTLDSVAKAMSQLQKFQFDKIGALQFHTEPSEDPVTVGPYYEWQQDIPCDDDYEPGTGVAEFGPFDTSTSYLQYFIDHEENKGLEHARGARILLEMMIPYLPPSTRNSSKETFVLSLPDYGPQNIMIDEEGNLTGIIDWYNVQTVPRFLGYSRFPAWITRDCDPLRYGYPMYKDRENSPEELKRYRSRYSATMRKMLRGSGDSKFTGKSHIFEAVEIAVMNPRMGRIDIVGKLVERIFPTEKGNGFSFIYDVGCGELKPKDRKRLQKGLQALLSIPKYCM